MPNTMAFNCILISNLISTKILLVTQKAKEHLVHLIARYMVRIYHIVDFCNISLPFSIAPRKVISLPTLPEQNLSETSLLFLSVLFIG